MSFLKPVSVDTSSPLDNDDTRDSPEEGKWSMEGDDMIQRVLNNPWFELWLCQLHLILVVLHEISHIIYGFCNPIMEQKCSTVAALMIASGPINLSQM